MFSDADPAVALDPKQQHRELTKPGIYSGIPVAVSCQPKITLCIALIFPENNLTRVFYVRQNIPSNAIFLVINAPKLCADLNCANNCVCTINGCELICVPQSYCSPEVCCPGAVKHLI